MKFLIFNIVVVAALGFILVDRGYLDRSVLDDMQAGAEELLERTGNPDLLRASEPEPPQVLAAVEEAVEPVQPSVEEQGRPAATVIEPPPRPAPTVPVSVRPAPVPVQEPPAVRLDAVAPEVAARRAQVLEHGPIPLQAAPSSARPDPDRVERLQALADELESMSVDMIYQ